MTRITIPLVGMGFHPPARQVLTVLPLGTELELSHESNNEYDPDAVAVHVDMSNYRNLSRLEIALVGTNFKAQELGTVHLGYLARSGAKTARGGPGNKEALKLANANGWGFLGLKPTLGADMDGAPIVVIDFHEAT